MNWTMIHSEIIVFTDESYRFLKHCSEYISLQTDLWLLQKLQLVITAGSGVDYGQENPGNV